MKLFPRDGRSNKEQHSLCEEEKTVIFFHWKRKAALSKTSYPCLYPFVVAPAKITLFLTSNSFPCGSFIAVKSANFHSLNLFKNARFLYVCLVAGCHIICVHQNPVVRVLANHEAPLYGSEKESAQQNKSSQVRAPQEEKSTSEQICN